MAALLYVNSARDLNHIRIAYGREKDGFVLVAGLPIRDEGNYLVILIERTLKDIDALAGCQYNPAALIDDGADWSEKIVKKPWGYERQEYRKGAWSFWQLIIEYGAETSMHCHPGKTTILLVESGIIKLETLGEEYMLRPGDSATIEPGAFHRSFAGMGAVLLEAESPPIKRDLVRLSDKWGRGQGYERAIG